MFIAQILDFLFLIVIYSFERDARSDIPWPVCIYRPQVAAQTRAIVRVYRSAHPCHDSNAEDPRDGRGLRDGVTEDGIVSRFAVDAGMAMTEDLDQYCGAEADTQGPSQLDIAQRLELMKL